MSSRLSRSISVVVEDQVKRLLSDINWIDYRLTILGDSEEDKIEKKLLSILKMNLVKDLESLLAFKSNGYRLRERDREIAG